ncbi:glycosyltransferase [uncultured Roseibium sp.]|uniref:glycosyltransferase n=1 Tax=uncultured Roseibium sp. TaxID=1936171 RepID=UPI002595F469|nr:glycosyltransferase [uncultured Roseibium sp.]
MISVIVPTLNSEADLAHCLAALVPAAAEGVVREVIVVDGGSSDNTERVADAAGCDWREVKGPRSERLAAGAQVSRRGEWLLFLPADTVLEASWHHEVQNFIERAERAGSADKTAAAFKLRFEAFGMGARVSEFMAVVRSRFLGMPDGSQGLLISRRFYQSLGGYRPLREMEDLDLVKRIGGRRLVFLRSGAVCSGRGSEPGQSDSLISGFRKSVARFCVNTLRLPPKALLKLHG